MPKIVVEFSELQILLITKTSGWEAVTTSISSVGLSLFNTKAQTFPDLHYCHFIFYPFICRASLQDIPRYLSSHCGHSPWPLGIWIAVLTRLTARPQSPRFPGITDTDRKFNIITSHFYNLVLTTGDTEECSLLQLLSSLFLLSLFASSSFSYLGLPHTEALVQHDHPM